MSKFDITSISVAESSPLHLKDAEDNLLFTTADEIQDDGSRKTVKIPVTVNVFGPGSDVYAKASAKRNSRQLDRLRKKGKMQISADEERIEGAEYLADIAAEFSANFGYPPAASKTGREFAVAVYSDRTIGFIADQVAEHVKEWANFSKGSAKS